MVPLHISSNGHFMDALEEFETYRAYKILNEWLRYDLLFVKCNALYNTILKINGNHSNESSEAC